MSNLNPGPEHYADLARARMAAHNYQEAAALWSKAAGCTLGHNRAARYQEAREYCRERALLSPAGWAWLDARYGSEARIKVAAHGVTVHYDDPDRGRGFFSGSLSDVEGFAAASDPRRDTGPAA